MNNYNSHVLSEQLDHFDEMTYNCHITLLALPLD